MYGGFLLILAPLFIGYLCKLPEGRLRQSMNRLIEYLVYLILALMGLSLGALDNLALQLKQMSSQALVLLLGLGLANLLALGGWARFSGWRLHTEEQVQFSRLHMLKGSLQLLGVVAAGVALGAWLPLPQGMAEQGAEYTLMLLLLFIGCQLRSSGIPLKQILLNPQGLIIALAVIGSSLLAGLLMAPYLQLSWNQSLALASGFGWYSLSAILIGEGMGPVWGGAAFFNDLARELVALLLIPILIRRAPPMAIGYGGATAMDFTLPIIQKSGGMSCVPVAIVSGFILSLSSPLLILFFLSLGS
ncbi:lysine exporter LysO family protein [Balneatrix alpica]|uniref:Lysine exporter LysO family protein n=1 Tax=Balneatrix alpica TaxID=75684 RepID=A0ABV5ZGF6_9GAMM|nr:lysine exporter LysO family protein [Balneatrix alpica]